MEDTAAKLGMIVKKKNEPAFLASQAHKKKDED